MPLADFLAELHTQSINHAALQALDLDSPTDHIQHIAQTIELSYRLLEDDEEPRTKNREPASTNEFVTQNSELKTQNSRARHILDFAAHCAPGAPIPLELLRRAALDEDSSIANPKSQIQNSDAASHRLVTIGLASYGDEGQTLSIHRLVAAYARTGQDQATATVLADQVADSLGGISYEINENGLPAKMLPLLPHAQHAAEAADQRGSAYTATLLNNLGSYFNAIAAYDDARAFYERALRIDEASFGPDHPEVAIDVNNLGMVLREQGDLPAARAFLERALRIFEQTLGTEHPSTRIARANLAVVLAAVTQPPPRPSLMLRLRWMPLASLGVGARWRAPATMAMVPWITLPIIARSVGAKTAPLHSMFPMFTIIRVAPRHARQTFGRQPHHFGVQGLCPGRGLLGVATHP